MQNKEDSKEKKLKFFSTLLTIRVKIWTITLVS
jgi:hypothetical protein